MGQIVQPQKKIKKINHQEMEMYTQTDSPKQNDSEVGNFIGIEISQHLSQKKKETVSALSASEAKTHKKMANKMIAMRI